MKSGGLVAFALFGSVALLSMPAAPHAAAQSALELEFNVAVTNDDGGTATPIDFPFAVNGVPGVTGERFPISTANPYLQMSRRSDYEVTRVTCTNTPPNGQPPAPDLVVTMIFDRDVFYADLTGIVIGLYTCTVHLADVDPAATRVTLKYESDRAPGGTPPDIFLTRPDESAELRTRSGTNLFIDGQWDVTTDSSNYQDMLDVHSVTCVDQTGTSVAPTQTIREEPISWFDGIWLPRGAGASFEFAAGHQYQCTLYETASSATLTIDPVVTNDDGRRARPADFHPLPLSGGSMVWGSPFVVEAGEIAIDAIGSAPSYVAADVSCRDRLGRPVNAAVFNTSGRAGVLLSLSHGDVVACTLRYDDVAPLFEPAPDGTAAYRSVGPVRVADTRHTRYPFTRLSTDTIRVAVPEATASAAALTVTVDGATTEGFVTAYPSGSARPNTSIVNFTPGTTVANSGIVPVGPGGTIDLYISGDADVIVDVSGVFVPAPSARAGRYVPLEEERRLIDTRSFSRWEADGSIVVPIEALDGVAAVMVNLTATNTTGWGFLTAYPSGTTRPETSVLNFTSSGQTRAAASIVPVANGAITIHRSVATDLIVDLVGYFTGPEAIRDSKGLFLPLPPTRVIDTRRSERVWPGGSVAGSPNVPYPAIAVAGNVTIVDANNAGYVSASARTSTVNADHANQTVANGAVSRLRGSGDVVFSADWGGHLLWDVSGMFLGTAEQAPPAHIRNTPPEEVLNGRAGSTGPRGWIFSMASIGVDWATVTVIPKTFPSPGTAGYPGGPLFSITAQRNPGEFRDLHLARPGDSLGVSTGPLSSRPQPGESGHYQYTVYAVELVLPNEVAEVDPSRDNEIQLVAPSCSNWRPGCFTHRIVVRAKQTSGPSWV